MRKLIIQSALMLLCAASCTQEIPYTPDNADDMLILNAQLDASQTHHVAYVGISRTTTITKLDEATVLCTVNGGSASRGVLEKNPNFIQSRFSFDAELHPGDTLRLSAEGAGLFAYAEIVVPDTSGRLLAVDTMTVSQGLHFAAKFQDIAPETNFYRLQLKSHSMLSYYVDHEWSAWHERILEIPIMHKNDPLLDARIGGSEGDDFFGFGGSTNYYCIFTDLLFANATGEISFSVDNSLLYRTFVDRPFEKLRIAPVLVLSLVSMPLEEYQYLYVQNVLYDSDFDASEKLEPITVPTNVIGGTGFVGVYYPSSIVIQLPQKLFP